MMPYPYRILENVTFPVPAKNVEALIRAVLDKPSIRVEKLVEGEGFTLFFKHRIFGKPDDPPYVTWGEAIFFDSDNNTTTISRMGLHIPKYREYSDDANQVPIINVNVLAENEQFDSFDKQCAEWLEELRDSILEKFMQPASVDEYPHSGFDISGSFEIPVEWNVLESHSEKCLDGFAPNYVEKEVIKKKSVSTTYRIWQEDLGELGTVEIIKLRDGFSEIVISGVPMDSVNNSPMWLKIKPEWDKKKSEALKSSLSKDEYWAVSQMSDEAMAKIAAKQKNHQAGVVKAYFNRLIQEVGIWKPNFPPPYILVIGGFNSVEDAYKRGEYFGDFIKGAWEAAAKLGTANQDAAQVGTDLSQITDPTDLRIWELIKPDPSITDTHIAQKLGNMTRQAVNTRRRTLEKMGYQVRRVSRQNK